MKKIYKLSAFTLAEMMVVLLILSIITAAFMPVITGKMRSTSATSDIWKWVNGGNLDAYFGEGDTQTAVVGANSTSGTAAKLIVNSNNADINSFPHMAFKVNNIPVGQLAMSTDRVQIGLPSVISVGSPRFEMDTVAIGQYVSAPRPGDVAIGFWAMNRSNSSSIPTDPNQSIYPNGQVGGNVAIGGGALNNISGGDRNIAIGAAAGNTAVAKYDNISIGAKTGALYTGNSNIAIGLGAQSQGVSGTVGSLDPNDTSTFVNDTIAIGKIAMATSSYSIAMGSAAEAGGNSSLSLGATSKAPGASSIAIGVQAQAPSTGTVSIGTNANKDVTDVSYSVAIGSNSKTTAYSSVAIGDNAKALKDASGMGGSYSVIAIGNYASATSADTIAIGSSATASSAYSSDNRKSGSSKV